MAYLIVVLSPAYAAGYIPGEPLRPQIDSFPVSEPDAPSSLHARSRKAVSRWPVPRRRFRRSSHSRFPASSQCRRRRYASGRSWERPWLASINVSILRMGPPLGVILYESSLVQCIITSPLRKYVFRSTITGPDQITGTPHASCSAYRVGNGLILGARRYDGMQSTTTFQGSTNFFSQARTAPIAAPPPQSLRA